MNLNSVPKLFNLAKSGSIIYDFFLLIVDVRTKNISTVAKRTYELMFMHLFGEVNGLFDLE